MEHLTKSQIVLLTLFVSFVASMATGIVVVTLMGQAPDPVNQTITNVVERTIEKITPTFVDRPGETVIVKDEDLVVAAIEKNVNSTVALRYVGQEGWKLPIGVGTIVSSDGLLITDKSNFDSGLLSAVVNGISYTIEVVTKAEGSPLVLARLVPVSATSTPAFSAVKLGNTNSLKLGQTSIVIGGRDGKTISTGLITSLDMRTIVDKETKEETKVLDNIAISTRFSATSNGAPIINLSGDVIGFLSIDESVGAQSGIPAESAKMLLNDATKPTPAEPVKK